MEKVIEKYPNYAVTDDGKVINLKTRKELKPVDNRHGYMRVNFRIAGKNNWLYVHHLVAETFLGPRPEGCEVDHIDHNRANNAVSNLRWVTRLENIHHSQHLMRGTIRKKVLKRPMHHISTCRGRYKVDIMYCGARYRWYFYDLEEAIRKRDAAYAEIHSAELR